MKPEQWIVTDDTGISSKTIWSVMMGVECHWTGTPSDEADFGRCHRLLEAIPEWKPRLHEVGDAFPAWKPLIQIWEKLTDLHVAEKHAEFRKLIRSVADDCKRADGLVEISPGCWMRPGSANSEFG